MYLYFALLNINPDKVKTRVKKIQSINLLASKKYSVQFLFPVPFLTKGSPSCSAFFWFPGSAWEPTLRGSASLLSQPVQVIRRRVFKEKIYQAVGAHRRPPLQIANYVLNYLYQFQKILLHINSFLKEIGIIGNP